ncbi:hypothetical protein CEXT_293811 [Caerostris extrusa]|uniref:Uncharacterized protein n=1 Tax=Caerostris extrusa TaxID=172846 RepID=A0AAV4VD11_CAEEX|nr:hypothetical protein CEXT_293811 [Caerostris extrusa]
MVEQSCFVEGMVKTSGLIQLSIRIIPLVKRTSKEDKAQILLYSSIVFLDLQWHAYHLFSRLKFFPVFLLCAACREILVPVATARSTESSWLYLSKASFIECEVLFLCKMP